MNQEMEQVDVLPSNEEKRLEALKNYHILDTLPEADFDALTNLASYICNTPIALISLIDTDRQWFKSNVGLGISQTDRNIAFCRYTILSEGVLEITDTHQNPLVSTNPLVTGDPNIRFYAGAPLTTPDGYNLGSLCVIDTIPRQLTEQQKTALQTLAREVVSHLELRASKAKLQKKTKGWKSLKCGLIMLKNSCVWLILQALFMRR
jgi:GAF domain-containing protein